MDRGNYGRVNADDPRGRGRDGGGDWRDGGEGGRDGGDWHGGRGNQSNQYHNQRYQQDGRRQIYRQQQGGSGDGDGGSWGPNQSGNYPPAAARPPGGQDKVGVYRPPHLRTPAAISERHVSGGRGGAWGPSSSSERTWVKPPHQQQPNSTSSLRNLTVSEVQPLLSLEDLGKSKVMSMKRPDHGGTFGSRLCSLLVNHFPVKFNENTTIKHYDVEIRHAVSSENSVVKKKPVLKTELRDIREKLFTKDPAQFPLDKTAYDGEKNIFSLVTLPNGNYKVQLSDGEGEGMKTRDFTVSIKFVNEIKLLKLKSYLAGEVMDIPREILQSMDLVMKENSSRHRISFSRSSFPKEFNRSDDLGCGVAAFRGFQQSLKPTYKGLAMCLDYSVMALRKRISVIEYLKENVHGFRGAQDVCRSIHEVTKALKGLKVTVTHRISKQKYIINGLTRLNARQLLFDVQDPEGKAPPRKIDLVSYFKAKYDREIQFKDIPCLDVGKNKRKNYIPMEFALLVEGQRYQKDKLDGRACGLLKKISMLPPKQRMETIYEMVQSEDGPCGGEVIRNFDMEVVKDMTKVAGRVITPPSLVVGNGQTVTFHKDKYQWSLLTDSVVDGKAVERWALIEFIFSSRGRFSNDFDQDSAEDFANDLVRRCRDMGIHMKDCLVLEKVDMNVLSDVGQVRGLLNSVIAIANQKIGGGLGLQLIVCLMTKQLPGYKNLKWVSETQIGVLTQCCLTSNAYNKGQGRDKFLENLALKINAKLGGINFQLKSQLPFFGSVDGVMFIGADVNHPAPFNTRSPSIAAVVATISLDKYIARVRPQEHRKEKIVNFGSICLDLVKTYARYNGAKPNKIVVFRDGVSEGQFDMVLNEELLDLKREIYEEFYNPTITVVVALKGHLTRLFLENERDGVYPGNVPPGTVVDTEIVHPFEFDFYLCSHFGQIGTSKPTHYYVLWDENGFTSDQIQELIYHLCFTFARCTKPVSLVPPVYYADIVASRGRKFQEAMDKKSASASSSSSSGVSWTSANFRDASFYKLHPDLENVMVFI